MFTLSVYNVQLRNIGRAKCIVCPTNPTVGRATALPANYIPAPPVMMFNTFVLCFVLSNTILSTHFACLLTITPHCRFLVIIKSFNAAECFGIPVFIKIPKSFTLHCVESLAA